MSFPVLLASTIGQIFQPLLQGMAWVLAFFYSIVPNYAIAIALLTVTVMLITAPLTVKSTRSMVEMQRVGPELKRIQAKHKGDRVQLNEEMMELYKEHGINPAGGCVPMLIQMPAFLVLYDVIKGLTNTVGTINPKPFPRYVGHQTKLYESLVHSGGKMDAFGINLALKANTHAFGGIAIVYWLLIAVAVGLQFVQVRQVMSRNPGAAQANPQAQMLQKYMPFIFAIIYIKVSAGVVIYFIVSTLCRILIQETMFRTGMVQPLDAHSPGSHSPRTKRTLMERLAETQQRAAEKAALNPGTPSTKAKAKATAADDGTDDNGAPLGESRGKPASNPAVPRKPTSNGRAGTSKTPAADNKTQHPRAKAKRARKTR